MTKTELELGNHIRFNPKTLASRRGLPSAIQELGRTKTAPPVENPKTVKTTGSNLKGLRGLDKHTVKTKV